MIQALRVLAALTCFFCALCPGFVSGRGFNIPVLRYPRPPSQAHTLYAYESNVSITNSHEYAYLARIGVGGQDLTVLLDTGSSDLWVVSSECHEEGCDGVTKYEPTSSLSLTQTSFDLRYLMGSVAGQVATEDVTLGTYEIAAQVFALANTTNGLALAGTGNSGILGLAFPFEASIPSTSGTTLLENIFSAFNDSDKFFAYRLGRAQTDTSFTIGLLDETITNSTSDFAFTPVVPAYGSVYDYWKMPLQRLTINGTAFTLSASKVPGAQSNVAVLDTGTTLVLGPSGDVDRFWASVGGARKTDDGWEVRCDRSISVGFVLGQDDSQREYFVDPADVSWKSGSHHSEWCMGGFQANDGVSAGDWLLGDTFLRNVYVIHQAATADRPPTIGLLSTTDGETSLAKFRQERGDDPTPPVPVLSSAPLRRSSALSGGAACGIAAACGVVFGSVLMLILWYFGCRVRSKKRSK
ncbi:acid protease [Panus rudis PR-1116 ss-1]|nr:acid protease [Panus rudis PR-1116 ss-1]